MDNLLHNAKKLQTYDFVWNFNVKFYLNNT